MKKLLMSVSFAALASVAHGENWEVGSVGDELRGSIEFQARLRAKHSVSLMNHTPYLLVVFNRCDDPSAYGVAVRSQGYIGSDEIDVAYRFAPNGSIKTEQWRASSSGTAVFPLNRKDFVQNILDSRRLIFEIEDFRGVAEQNTFEWDDTSAVKDVTSGVLCPTSYQ